MEVGTYLFRFCIMVPATEVYTMCHATEGLHLLRDSIVVVVVVVVVNRIGM